MSTFPLQVIAPIYGALLIGSVIAIALSAIVNLQTWIYFKNYPDDDHRVKLVIAVIWIVDCIHTAALFQGLWHNFILEYGNVFAFNTITWGYVAAAYCTTITTLIVHCFYAHRIFKFSGRNWYIASLILFLNICRFVAGLATASEMIKQGLVTVLRSRVLWLVTLGLSLSSGVDIVVTSTLWYYLRASKVKSFTMDRVIDLLVTCVLETGSLTCAATFLAMICWVTMKSNMIFMGIYLTVEKLFAISILVTLNLRRELRGTDRTANSSNPQTFSALELGSNLKSTGDSRRHFVYRDPVSPSTERMVLSTETTSTSYKEDTPPMEFPVPHTPAKAWYAE